MIVSIFTYYFQQCNYHFIIIVNNNRLFNYFDDLI